MNAQTTVKVRGIVSLLLIIDFILVSISGLIGFVRGTENAPRMHPYLGILMMILVMVHLSLNYKMFLTEVKMLFKRK